MVTTKPDVAPRPGSYAVTLLILGAGGDLTKRLLLPGLASLLSVESDRKVTVVGADRVSWSDDDFGAVVRESFADTAAPAATVDRVAGGVRYHQVDLLDRRALAALIGSCTGPLVIYFALPPEITMKVCAVLESVELPADTRLGLEKPFGTSESSARDFNDQLHRVVPEQQVYRVDHFMGTSTVLNLIGLRFASRVLQPVWSNQHIERVEIVYDEDLALEGRAGYYDHAGALRDMLQSHLLEILAIFAMEPIATLEPDELHDLKCQVLRATRIWDDDPVRYSRRARYTTGALHGTRVPAYVDEPGVDPSLNTETLAQMVVEVRNNRWAGVPILLRSGKAMATPHKQIICYFRRLPHQPTGFTGDLDDPDKLIIGIKPGRVSLELSMNAEGDPLSLEPKTLSANLTNPPMTSYGEVLRHILDGNQLITVRNDAAEHCWHIVAPVLDAFASNAVPIEEYPAGSRGPRGWLEPDSLLLRS